MATTSTVSTSCPANAWTAVATAVTTAIVQVSPNQPYELWVGTSAPAAGAQGLQPQGVNGPFQMDGLGGDGTLYLKPLGATAVTATVVKA